jgi:FkbM family methyltransferase
MAAAARARPPVAPLDYRRRRLVVTVASPAVAHSRLHPVAKEPWTAAWLDARVGPSDAVWDVGANVGGYSLIAAAAGAARVVAVEPAPASYAALCENVRLNGFEHVITPLPVVLAARTSVALLDLGDPLAGATHRLAADGTAVLGFALDDLLERFELPAPTLLKLDVDGSEADVLAGAATTLARPELRSVLIEIETASEDAVAGAMGAAGYALAERYSERDGVALNDIWYGVFERSS